MADFLFVSQMRTGDPLATFLLWIVCDMLADLLISVFIVEKENANSIGNKENKNQPIGNKCAQRDRVVHQRMNANGFFTAI
jgi:hypothetical protein